MPSSECTKTHIQQCTNAKFCRGRILDPTLRGRDGQEGESINSGVKNQLHQLLYFFKNALKFACTSIWNFNRNDKQDIYNNLHCRLFSKFSNKLCITTITNTIVKWILIIQKSTRMQDFACKISKISRGLYPRTPLAGGGDPLPAPTPSTAFGRARGHFAPPAPRSQTPKINKKFTQNPPILKLWLRHWWKLTEWSKWKNLVIREAGL